MALEIFIDGAREKDKGERARQECATLAQVCFPFPPKLATAPCI